MKIELRPFLPSEATEAPPAPPPRPLALGMPRAIAGALFLLAVALLLPLYWCALALLLPVAVFARLVGQSIAYSGTLLLGASATIR